LIASSIVTGIVFSHNVTDSGMQMIGRILTAVSVLMLVLTVFDRTLKTPKSTTLRGPFRFRSRPTDEEWQSLHSPEFRRQ
jgi:hypothetical protein